MVSIISKWIGVSIDGRLLSDISQYFSTDAADCMSDMNGVSGTSDLPLLSA